MDSGEKSRKTSGVGLGILSGVAYGKWFAGAGVA